MITITLKNKLKDKKSPTKGLVFALFFSLISPFTYANGGVGLNATRIVYNQGAESTSIGARNNSDINYLAKFSVLNSEKGTNANVPFIVSPPLIKITKQTSQDVKVYIQPNNLPQDRESVFYFSGILIPATDGPIPGSSLNIGYNNIIKLFYRPKGLQISPQEAYAQLSFKSTPTGVTAVNNSPYYISLNQITVNSVNLDINMKKNNTMISPFDSFNYNTPENARKGIVKWVAINDLGGEDVYSGQIQ